MADDDIYGNQRHYNRFKESIKDLHKPAKHRHYHCKNPNNITYFYKLCSYLESKDLSYVLRLRLMQTLKLVTFVVDKDLKRLERDDINEVMAYAHTRYNTVSSKKTFVKHLKYIWKILFPVLDEKGLPDERLIPHEVRHLSTKVDKAKQKARKDKLTWQEYDNIFNYFSNDPRMQAYLSLALESLGRPQEICYTKVGDVELFDNYAKINLSSHTKEGIGILQCIDSYPYVLKWLEVHPRRNDPEAFLFVNLGDQKKGSQLHPYSINKMLKNACNKLSIPKTITCYSLKRNGVTFRRLRGDSDVQIQHAARWTSTKQLKTYDQSDQLDALRVELVKRGYLEDDSTGENTQKPKICYFCEHKNGHAEITCEQCKRPLDRNKLREEAEKKDKQFDLLLEEIKGLKEEIGARKKQDPDLNQFFNNKEAQQLFKLMYMMQDGNI